MLSPVLFTVYLDELLHRMSNSRLGCYIGNIFCGTLAYADDVIINVAPSVACVVCYLFVKVLPTIIILCSILVKVNC